MFKHIPVLYDQVIEGLKIRPGGTYLDGTVGGGGHSRGILEAIGKEGRLIAMDQDTNALKAAKANLADFSDQVIFAHKNFRYLDQVVSEHCPDKLDGILLDIGVSSHQIDSPERGFSYMHDAPLDMRMNQEAELTAYDVVNGYSVEELSRVLWEYGEEKWAKRIAEIIAEHRVNKPIETTYELVDMIERAIPKKAREKGSHVGKRTFQALRIEVNQELEVLKEVIHKAVDCLKPEGRLAIITFHSLEDRIVKEEFKYLEASCICPPELPFCTCNKKSTVKIITRKPLVASPQELEENRRAKSAKLRIAEKKDV